MWCMVRVEKRVLPISWRMLPLVSFQKMCTFCVKSIQRVEVNFKQKQNILLIIQT